MEWRRELLQVRFREGVREEKLTVGGFPLAHEHGPEAGELSAGEGGGRPDAGLGERREGRGKVQILLAEAVDGGVDLCATKRMVEEEITIWIRLQPQR